MSIILVTHDLGVVADLCDDVSVMYAGEIVETGSVRDVLMRPEHPYTMALLAADPHAILDLESTTRLASIPGQVPLPGSWTSGCRFAQRCRFAKDECLATIPLEPRAVGRGAVRCIRRDEVRGRQDEWRAARHDREESDDEPQCRASDGAASARCWRCATSSSGTARRAPPRSTTCRSPSRAARRSGWSASRDRARRRSAAPSSACSRSRAVEIWFEGRNITRASVAERRALQGDLRAVFQDPFSSLNPRRPIGDALTRAAARVAGVPRAERTCAPTRPWPRWVFPPGSDSRYPRQFSGGQRQRIAIARALVTDPRLVVCDEAVSALDLSTQAQVLNLLADLRAGADLGYLFIAHDMAVVEFLAQRVVVLNRGRIVEQGTTARGDAEPAEPLHAGAHGRLARSRSRRAGPASRGVAGAEGDGSGGVGRATTRASCRGRRAASGHRAQWKVAATQR